jgi:hypothetical protein
MGRGRAGAGTGRAGSWLPTPLASQPPSTAWSYGPRPPQPLLPPPAAMSVGPQLARRRTRRRRVARKQPAPRQERAVLRARAVGAVLVHSDGIQSPHTELEADAEAGGTSAVRKSWPTQHGSLRVIFRWNDFARMFTGPTRADPPDATTTSTDSTTVQGALLGLLRHKIDVAGGRRRLRRGCVRWNPCERQMQR